MLKRFVSLVVGAVIVTGCGGGDGKSSTVTTVRDVDADRAVAQRLVLTVADLEAGWEASPHTDDADSPDLSAQFNRCAGITEDLMSSKNEASADSDDFKQGDAQVTNNVTLSVTAAKAKQGFDDLAKPAVPGCLATLLEKELTDEMAKDPSSAGIAVGKVTFNRMSFPVSADRTMAFRVTAPLTIEGQTIALYLDMVFVQHDRTTSTLQFQSVGTPFPIAAATRLAEIAGKRIVEGS